MIETPVLHHPAFSLHFRFRRGQNGRHNLRFKPTASVRSVAEGFVVAITATAQANDRSARQVVFGATAVVDFDVAFDTQRTIIIDGNFRRHRFNPLLASYFSVSYYKPAAVTILNQC